MTRCLFTQYLDEVNNDNLPIYGSIKIEFSCSSPKILGDVRFTTTEVLLIKGDGYFTDSSYTQNLGKTLTINADTQTRVYVSSGTFDVYIPNKFELKILQSDALQSGYGGNITIDQIKNCEKLTYFLFLDHATGTLTQEIANTLSSIISLKCLTMVTTAEIVGSLETLKELQSDNISGHLNDLLAHGNKIWTDIRVAESSIDGEIATFCEAMADMGRITGSTYIRANRYMTFNGNAVSAYTNFTVSWMSATKFRITTSGTTYEYTKTGNVWSYEQV